jgi:hypothetical protein
VAANHVVVVDAADIVIMLLIVMMLLPISVKLLPMRQLTCQLLDNARLLCLLSLSFKLPLRELLPQTQNFSIARGQYCLQVLLSSIRSRSSRCIFRGDRRSHALLEQSRH